MSKPHFLDADPSVRARLNTSRHCLAPPDRARDDSTFDIEPMSGITVHGRQRFQFNIHLMPDLVVNPLGSAYDFTMLGGVDNHSYVPVMWFSAYGDLHQDDARVFMDLSLVLDAVEAFAVFCFACGAPLALAYSLRRRTLVGGGEVEE